MCSYTNVSIRTVVLLKQSKNQNLAKRKQNKIAPCKIDVLTSFECNAAELPLGRVPCAPLGGELGPESGLLWHTCESTEM